jgi:shikimate dehydrogenase
VTCEENGLMISVSGKTRVYGIIGDPVAHSLSPLMQNRAFQAQGIEAVYVPFHVTPEQLPAAVDGLRALGVAGWNVTVPHKEAVLPLLDEVDARAQLIGAVNTVVCQNGRLVGYNTDAPGFLHAVRDELHFEPPGKKVVLLGAGGACRAAVVALAEVQVAAITVANRSVARAEKLCHALAPHFPEVEFIPLAYSDPQYLSRLAEADLIVNSTAVGLAGEEISFLPLDCIKGSALISDMVYSVSEAPLIKKAHSLKFKAAGGLGMLAAQGQEAFRLWTGIELAPGFMRRFLAER